MGLGIVSANQLEVETVAILAAVTAPSASAPRGHRARGQLIGADRARGEHRAGNRAVSDVGRTDRCR